MEMTGCKASVSSSSSLLFRHWEIHSISLSLCYNKLDDQRWSLEEYIQKRFRHLISTLHWILVLTSLWAIQKSNQMTSCLLCTKESGTGKPDLGNCTKSEISPAVSAPCHTHSNKSILHIQYSWKYNNVTHKTKPETGMEGSSLPQDFNVIAWQPNHSCFTSGHPKLAFFLPVGLPSAGRHSTSVTALSVLTALCRSMNCISHKLRRSFNPNFPLAETGWSWTSPLLTYLPTAKEISEVLKCWRRFWHWISVSYWLRPAATCLRSRIWNLPSGCHFGSCKPSLAQSCELCYYGLNSAWHCLRFFFCQTFKIERNFEKQIAEK